MGGSESKKEKHVVTEDIKIEHERFRHFIYHEDTDQLEIKMDMQSEKDYQNWVYQLKKLNEFQEKQTLLLPVKHQYVNKGLCGTAGTLNIFYENYPYLFQEEIDNRIQMDKHFEEEQLWYLLYSLVSSSTEFSKLTRKVGDIRPYNIFINEEGQIKIANIYSWPYERTNFDKTAFEKTLTYLAPEQMKLISKGSQDNSTNKVTAESFSIGLTLLQAGLLFNAREIYSINNFTMDLELLGRKVSNWRDLEFKTQNDVRRQYSHLLRTIVAEMCNPDDQERLRSVDVEEILRPYQNEILNLRQFDQRNVRLPAKYARTQEVVYVEQRGSPQRNTAPEYAQMVNTNVTRQTQIVIPQQTVVMNRPQQIRVNQFQYASLPVGSHSSSNRPVSSQSPPRQYVVRPESSEQEHRGQVRFNAGETVYIKDGQRVQAGQSLYQMRPQPIPVYAHEQQFHKYSAPNNYPSQPQMQRIQNGGAHEQFFNKYATLNQGQEQRDVTSTVNYRSTTTGTYNIGGNTLNYNGANFTTSTTKQWQAPVKIETTTSQFSRPYSTNTQVVTTSVGGSGEGSDFLRKIDEQLEASRRQFPSR